MSDREFEITHLGRIIRYRLTPGRSRLGTVSLRVRRDGQVLVSVPPRVPVHEAHRIVREKADWISHYLDRAAAEAPSTPAAQRFVSGEQHPFLGRLYPLQIVPHAKVRPVLAFDGEAIRIHSRSEEPAVLQAAMDRWYRQQLGERIEHEIRDLVTGMPWVKTLPDFRLKAMQSRWGSCSSRGNLNFSVHLVKAHPQAIRYVVLHELCHLAEMNHSERFWRLVEERMPEWREHRVYFKQHGGRLMQS